MGVRMKPEDIINQYRQALSLVSGKDIARETKAFFAIANHPKTELDGRFWVNIPKRKHEGGLIFSPTGWKSYATTEFESEIKKLFDEASTTQVKFKEGRK